jgi:hypothetical protein
MNKLKDILKWSRPMPKRKQEFKIQNSNSKIQITGVKIVLVK